MICDVTANQPLEALYIVMSRCAQRSRTSSNAADKLGRDDRTTVQKPSGTIGPASADDAASAQNTTADHIRICTLP
jgi:hypothetical protein